MDYRAHGLNLAFTLISGSSTHLLSQVPWLPSSLHCGKVPSASSAHPSLLCVTWSSPKVPPKGTSWTSLMVKYKTNSPTPAWSFSVASLASFNRPQTYILFVSNHWDVSMRAGTSHCSLLAPQCSLPGLSNFVFHWRIQNLSDLPVRKTKRNKNPGIQVSIF